MYWKEDNQDNSNKTDNKIVDISFKVNCAKISADHAYDLFKNSKLVNFNRNMRIFLEKRNIKKNKNYG